MPAQAHRIGQRDLELRPGLLQIASLIWDPVEVRRSITTEFGALMGQEVGRQIETMVASAEEKASGTGVGPGVNRWIFFGCS